MRLGLRRPVHRGQPRALHKMPVASADVERRRGALNSRWELRHLPDEDTMWRVTQFGESGVSLQTGIRGNVASVPLRVQAVSRDRNQQTAADAEGPLMPSREIVIVARFQEPAEFMLSAGPEHKVQHGFAGY
jgi:hypothetical protein